MMSSEEIQEGLWNAREHSSETWAQSIPHGKILAALIVSSSCVIDAAVCYLTR